MPRNFALPPIRKGTIVFIAGVGTLAPLLAGVGLVAGVREGDVDPLVALAILALTSLTMLAVLLPMWRRQVAIDGGELAVKAAYYSRRAPLSAFDLAQAQVADLAARDEWRPWVKTNGAQLPGYHAGHFRLRGGRKAFCLITDPAKVLVLPHADGRVWLLSFEHPQAVLDILRRAAG